MGTGPDPEAARTPAEFVHTMRQLRSWAGLSYRQLERGANDAGDVLPRATMSGVLAREDLPREELLAAFVRACGANAATVDTWLDTRRRLAVSAEPAAPAWTTGEPRPEPETEAEPAARTAADTESRMTRTPCDEQSVTDSAAEAPSPDTVKGSADSPVRPAPPDDAAHTTVTTKDTDSEQTGPTGPTGKTGPTGRPTPRRGRRLALIAALSVVVLVLVPGVIGIALLPDDANSPPRVTPRTTPAVSTSPLATPSDVAKPVTAPPTKGPDTTQTHSPNTRTPTPTPPAEGGPQPSPEPPGSDPTSPPYEPGPSHWDLPPWTPSSPPGGTGGTDDTFPGETCQDLTNDCV